MSFWTLAGGIKGQRLKQVIPLRAQFLQNQQSENLSNLEATSSFPRKISRGLPKSADLPAFLLMLNGRRRILRPMSLIRSQLRLMSFNTCQMSKSQKEDAENRAKTWDRERELKVKAEKKLEEVQNSLTSIWGNLKNLQKLEDDVVKERDEERGRVTELNNKITELEKPKQGGRKNNPESQSSDLQS